MTSNPHKFSPFTEDLDKTLQKRSSQYGDVSKGFEQTAKAWEAILKHPVTAQEVVLCMIALKTCRLTHDPNSKDSWKDIAGYAACGSIMAKKEVELLW